MMDRRRFLEFFAATGVAGTGFAESLWAQTQERPESPISAAMIAHAESVAGLEFTDDEREMMRNGRGVGSKILFELKRRGIKESLAREALQIAYEETTPEAVFSQQLASALVLL